MHPIAQMYQNALTKALDRFDEVKLYVGLAPVVGLPITKDDEREFYSLKLRIYGLGRATAYAYMLHGENEKDIATGRLMWDATNTPESLAGIERIQEQLAAVS